MIDVNALEQQWLAQLEQSNQLGMSRVLALAPNDRAATVYELSSVIAYLGQLEGYFSGYEAVALYLRSMGRPRLFDRLQQLLADLRQAKAIYTRSFRGAPAPSPPPRSPSPAAPEVSALDDAMKRQQDAFDAHFAQWQSGFNKACAHCKNPLGDAYHHVAVCPHCGRFPKG